MILILMPFLYTLFVIDNPEDDHKNIYSCCSNPRPIVPRLENNKLKIEPVPDILALTGEKKDLSKHIKYIQLLNTLELITSNGNSKDVLV